MVGSDWIIFSVYYFLFELNFSLVYSFFLYPPLRCDQYKPRNRIMSLSKSLSQNDVNELVLEYLASSGFSEAESTFRKEMAGKVRPVPGSVSSSRLEVGNIYVVDDENDSTLMITNINFTNRSNDNKLCVH